MSAPTLTEHKVTLQSKIPANLDETVQLPVREYDGTKPNQARKPVLMLHGRSVPALAAFDLAPVPGGRATRYSLAQELADDDFDVFVMDLQGSGRSPRPRMDDPCNANPVQQPVLVPNPLQAPCPPPPPYAFQLGNSESEWAELDAVVRYIRGLPGRNKPIRFIGYSLGGAIMGPYALQHPENVESLLLLAPVFPPRGRWSDNPAQPFGRPAEAQQLPMSQPALTWGFPMFVGTKTGFKNGLDGNPALREPDIADYAWDACMESDPEGSKWGREIEPGRTEGILRYRNTYWWGWNDRTVPHQNPTGTYVLGERIPVLIVYGELDRAANSPASFPDAVRFSVPALYTAVKGPRKLMFCLAGAGHSLVWETTAETVHRLSKQWFKHGKAEGQADGSYFVDANGELTPLP
ncbi:alpha/beta fold hydrolase [Streptomyces sp. enrichment culture]|uniref:alpha/beta fold hydrolase n=1 Tax=Streptomyces sp. enrichment culture TaxID=1795815 RepID=UPI003F55934C